MTTPDARSNLTLALFTLMVALSRQLVKPDEESTSPARTCAGRVARSAALARRLALRYGSLITATEAMGRMLAKIGAPSRYQAAMCPNC